MRGADRRLNQAKHALSVYDAITKTRSMPERKIRLDSAKRRVLRLTGAPTLEEARRMLMRPDKTPKAGAVDLAAANVSSGRGVRRAARIRSVVSGGLPGKGKRK